MIQAPAQTTFPFLANPALTQLQQCFVAAGGELRVVGGAVRDALLGRPAGEIDLASTLPPERGMEILKAAGIKVVPTGLAHGTITAVVDHVGYEITTLRRDVETDGRHAVVEYTSDWQADAARRDFTMNAMYVDASGKLTDYFGGQEDATAGRVRFIGNAAERISEDVLRILRFFRFNAVFGKGAPDVDALEACAQLARRIPSLSVERVWREIIKLLAAPDPVPAWRLMQDGGVLGYILPDAANLTRLEKLLAVEKRVEAEPAALIRLVALLPDNIDVTTLAARLKLSNREADMLAAYVKAVPLMRGVTDPVPLHRLMYQHRPSVCRAALLIVGAEDAARDVKSLYDIACSWEPPSFPLQGEDIVKLGIAPGPRVGDILKTVEAWWMGDDFHATRDECLAEARKLSVG